MLVVCANDGETFAFADPIAVLRADAIDAVAIALADADRAVASGLYVAGFVTYEAGAAFVARQSASEAGALPLVALGVYRAPVAVPRASGRPIRLGAISPRISQTAYDANIANVLERIREGDVYQVNLAVPFDFACDGHPYDLYTALAAGDVFPYASYAELGGHAIVSCSPELFVRFDGDRLVTKPMKGTSAVESTAALASAKNRAEHVMIVDLLRNDMYKLGGSVDVEGLAQTERYPTFATMTSTLVARRRAAFSLAETFAAMFPCGSITGAPKVTAMQAIAERESARGIFCGSIGYRAPGGDGLWNVAIRTATIDRARGRGTIHIGGGIVADSQPRDEWAEILIKRRFIDRLAPAYGLLETLRRNADGTYHEREAHLARLCRSADALHFAFDATAIELALDTAPQTDTLVRLQLESDGRFTLTFRSPVEDCDAIAIWSSQVVDPDEPLQRHKTTWRPHYETAAAEARAQNAFDAVLRTASGRIADGARTNVFVDDGGGMLLTPPISDGALPGILRERLIAQGKALERRLTASDIAVAKIVYLGNSARGLRKITMSDTGAARRVNSFPGA